jgi:hypothetical protein
MKASARVRLALLPYTETTWTEFIGSVHLRALVIKVKYTHGTQVHKIVSPDSHDD